MQGKTQQGVAPDIGGSAQWWRRQEGVSDVVQYRGKTRQNDVEQNQRTRLIRPGADSMGPHNEPVKSMEATPLPLSALRPFFGLSTRPANHATTPRPWRPPHVTRNTPRAIPATTLPPYLRGTTDPSQTGAGGRSEGWSSASGAPLSLSPSPSPSPSASHPAGQQARRLARLGGPPLPGRPDQAALHIPINPSFVISLSHARAPSSSSVAPTTLSGPLDISRSFASL